MKILLLLLLFTAPCLAQNHIQMWDTTLTTQTTWLNRTFSDNGQSAFNIDIYDSTGGAYVFFAFSNADTAAASGGFSGYHRIDGGTSFSYPNRSSNKFFIKSSGTAHIRVYKY